MRCHHPMPFGATVMAGGGVRFRLWAPGSAGIGLQLEAPGAQSFIEHPMQAQAAGWHELDVPAAAAGWRYRFRLPETVCGGLCVPDPAARFNPVGVHGPSEVIDPAAFAWPDAVEADWQGRPWETAVIYELHVGSFSATGDFAGVAARLDYLVALGVTVLEIMPVADFPGRCNWGYDGVLPFAPAARYGRPEDFKRLVSAAHARGLMVILDVVYNHLGPEGNYLHGYCPDFFNPQRHTPWGAALNFDGAGSRTVRDFFIHNALYWIEEYRLDGLRLDAIHALHDDSVPDLVAELRGALCAGPGRTRSIHLVLENDRNEAHRLNPVSTDKSRCRSHGIAQWNDDFHHAWHVLATGEKDGYYADYAADAPGLLARCLTDGFAFQGEPSAFRNGEPRGEPSAHLPPTAFVNFLQTHDQVGNRAFGERLCQLAAPAALEAATAVLLLAPQPPLIFMGDEFAARQPFLFFCDFGPDLAPAVSAGRRREFAGFAAFADPAALERIPDPQAASSFDASVLDWSALEQPAQARMQALYRQLLALRRCEIVPRLAGMAGGTAIRVPHASPRVVHIRWQLGDGSLLELCANLGDGAVAAGTVPTGRRLFATPRTASEATLPAWSVAWYLASEGG
jgi:maltooligosyltrehalose trehalohydrolase